MNNLAYSLNHKGDHARAEVLYRRAMEGRNRVLGPEHPDTLTSVNNLAGLLERKRDYAGAEPLYRQALEGLLNISAASQRPHPNLQTFIRNHTGCLEKCGRNDNEIRDAVEAMMRPFRIKPSGNAEHATHQPPP